MVIAIHIHLIMVMDTIMAMVKGIQIILMTEIKGIKISLHKD